jgi:hypothetical protein
MFPWFDGPSGAGGVTEVVSPEGWFVRNCWFLLLTRQVAIEVCGWSLPDCPRWSDMFVFSPAGSWVTQQSQFWLVSSSPNKVGQLSVLSCPQSYDISSVIYHTPALGGWLLTPPLLSEFGFLPYACSLRLVQSSMLPLLTAMSYVTVYGIQFCLWGVQSSYELHWIMFPGGHVLCGGSPVGIADAHQQSWVQASGVYIGCLQVMGPVHCRIQFSLILNLLLFARKVKKKGGGGRNGQRLFPKQMCPSGCAIQCQVFSSC